MDTNRLSKSIAAALNAQMTNEAHASQIYLSYAAWLSGKGYDGTANFLFRHAEEERNHMMKILEYILERGAKVEVTAIPAPGADPTSVNNCFEKVFRQETENTASIYKIVKMCYDEQDWATLNFMQWFVKEQVEEEALALNLLDKIRIAGGEKAQPDVLYTLDRDLASAPDEVQPAQEATAAKP